MGLNYQDFEFFTFYLGMRQHELQCFKQLLASFPYFDTHPINVVDQSSAVKTLLKTNPEKFYIDWQAYKKAPKRDVNDAELENIFSQYSSGLNRIIETERLFHGQAIDKVMNKYAKAPFVVVMDDDIEFISDRYLPDMLNLCGRYPLDELAAVGLLYQQDPFHLTLSPEVPPKFYRGFLTSRKFPNGVITNRNNRIPWKSVVRAAMWHLFKRRSEIKRKSFVGRFPRLHPALLLVNRRLFCEHQMTFRHLYLDVLDIKDGFESQHRVFGDNGASFLYQCSLAAKRIISIDIDDYVIHLHNVSVSSVSCDKSYHWSKEKKYR